MIDINDLRLIEKYDRSHQLSIMDHWPLFCKEAYKFSTHLVIPSQLSLKTKTLSYKCPSSIVIAAMGGSAISGEYLVALLSFHCPVPIFVSRGYSLPSFVNDETLVICISYSGNTEETLSMLYHALQSNAMVITISSGGYLEAIAREKSIPHIKIKEGLMPRASFPLIYISLLAILEKFGFRSDLVTTIDETSTILKSLQKKFSAINFDNNLAKELALELYNAFPVIIGHGLYSPVAYRAKCQFNENSKILALAEFIPEQNHNSIVAFDHTDPSLLNRFVFILLRDKASESDSIKLRFDMLKQFAVDLGLKVFELSPSGSSPLARQLSLTYLIDYTSIYLGILYGLDPSETLSIRKLKAILEEKQPIKKTLFHNIQEI